MIPSAGGTGPYLAIRARIPSIARQDVDDAVSRMDVLELPSVRDTAFLVPRADAKYYAFDSGGTRSKRVDVIRR